jgi:TetR/AcrR family transcriptional regulator, transcriptional repressor for nem operon
MIDRAKHSETVEKILDIAETLIQTRGYSAFSYQDISRELGIRKASIHYHFPSKTDLGGAVIDRYAERFGMALTAIAADPAATALSMLDHYLAPYLSFAQTDDRICLCGALAGEMPALPADMRKRVDRFFRTHQDWLGDILRRGAARGEFHLSAPPAKMARLVFGALQGALLVKRTTGDLTQFRDVVTALKRQLTASN